MIDFADFELFAAALLFTAALVAIASHRLRLPYTSALVVAGVVISLASSVNVSLSRDLIFLVFLPPLLFEGAINMDLRELRRRWDRVTALAVLGTLVTAGVSTLFLGTLTGLPWNFALLLAVMLAPTDPVSVLASMKQHGVGSGLRTLLEGESVFNDALGIVLFSVALGLAFPEVAAEQMTLYHGLRELLFEIGVGVGVGLVAGYATHRLMQLRSDHLVEITLSIVLSYVGFLAADRLGGSGVIAVVVGGLLIGNYGTYRAMAPASEVILRQFWEVIAFLMNSALFLLIGIEFDAANLAQRSTAVATLVAIGSLLVGRAIAVYGLLATPGVGSARQAVPNTWKHAVFWGGLLGGSIPIALALGLSREHRFLGEVDALVVVFGTVVFSLLVQGLTFAPVLRRLGLVEVPLPH